VYSEEDVRDPRALIARYCCIRIVIAFNFNLLPSAPLTMVPRIAYSQDAYAVPVTKRSVVIVIDDDRR